MRVAKKWRENERISLKMRLSAMPLYNVTRAHKDIPLKHFTKQAQY